MGLIYLMYHQVVLYQVLPCSKTSLACGMLLRERGTVERTVGSLKIQDYLLLFGLFQNNYCVGNMVYNILIVCDRQSARALPFVMLSLPIPPPANLSPNTVTSVFTDCQ